VALFAVLAAASARAETHYYTLSGSTAGSENACPGWVLANGDDCSYNNSHPLGLGQAQWIGPVFSAGYYAPGSAPLTFTSPAVPAPVTAPAAVLPPGGATGIPIRAAFLAIDDSNTVAGSDDYISGTVEFDGFERNVATSAGARIVESFGSVIHKLARVRVSSAAANAGGGWDYVVALAGSTPAYPALLTGSTTAHGGFSDSFPSQVASQSSADASDVPYWSGPVTPGIATLEGSNHAKGTSSTATIWGYACQDGAGAPAMDDCQNAFLAWSGDLFAGFSNILLKVSTNAAGAITSAQALLVQETWSNPAAAGADTWLATRLDFTGSSTALPMAFDDRSILITPLGSTSIDVLANDLPGVAPATVSIVSGPAQGTASVVSNRILYQRGDTPASVQDISYRITDAEGHSATATAQILITDPVACVDDAASGTKDTPVTVNVLANDSGFDIPPVTLLIASQPAAGHSVVNPDRTITFTPPPGKGGSYVTQYRLADGSGRPVSCRLTVRLPGTPQAVDDSAAALQGGNITIDVLANDLEVTDTPLTLQLTQLPAHGSASIDSSGPVPRVRYTPVAGYAGADSLHYTVTDSDGDISNVATVTLTVVGPPGNDVPKCTDDSFDGQRNATTLLDVLANDTGLNAPPVTVAVLDVYPGGSATTVVNADNTIGFTPGTDQGGTFYVTYSAREAVNNPVTCTAVVKVNDVPVAKDDAYDGINFGSTQSLGVLNNDLGLADVPLTLEITAPPAHGSLQVCAAVAPECPGFTAGAAPYVSYRYTDAAGYPASDQFRYRIVDANGDSSNEATVRITVRNALEAANDPTGFNPALAAIYPPTAFQSVGYATSSGHSVTLNVLRNDGGFLNGPVTVRIVAPPAQGKVVVNGDNTLTYTAADDQTGLVQFSYSVTDALDHSASADVGVYVFPQPKSRSGGSAMDPALLVLLLGGLLLRWRGKVTGSRRR